MAKTKYQEVNLRYLVQGMIKVPLDDLPDGFDDMTPQQVMEWADDYFRARGKNELVAGVDYLDPEEDSKVGAVEVLDDEDFSDLVWRKEWAGFMDSGVDADALRWPGDQAGGVEERRSILTEDEEDAIARLVAGGNV